MDGEFSNDGLRSPAEGPLAGTKPGPQEPIKRGASDDAWNASDPSAPLWAALSRQPRTYQSASRVLRH